MLIPQIMEDTRNQKSLTHHQMKRYYRTKHSLNLERTNYARNP